MSIVMLIAGIVLGGAFAAALLLGRLRTEHALRLAAQASHTSQLELLDASRAQLRDEMKGISAAVLEKTAESLTRELSAQRRIESERAAVFVDGAFQLPEQRRRITEVVVRRGQGRIEFGRPLERGTALDQRSATLVEHAEIVPPGGPFVCCECGAHGRDRAVEPFRGFVRIHARYLTASS